MSNMLELAIILLLVAINGLLSGAEMAVVSVRRGRLQAAADAGSGNAATVLRLRHDPERFLATVQVGITLIGAMAGAFGGSSLASVLTPWLAELPGCAAIADDLAFALVVGLITYLSVVFGELIPKSLALRHAEPIALVLARPVLFLEFLARPLIWLLVRSSNLVLRPFHDSTNFVESKLTRDDLMAMVTEASGQSVLAAETQQVLARAIEFAGLSIADVMVPRRWVVALPLSAGEPALKKALLEDGHGRVPVYEGGLDEIRGYLLREDVLARLWERQPIELPALLRPAFFLPETMAADKALRELQEKRLQMAIVVDENGGTAGLVTLEDLVEELVGEIFNERDRELPESVVQEANGNWLVPGRTALREFTRRSGIDLELVDEVRTVGGLCVHLAGGNIPTVGAVLHADGAEITVVEVSARRVRRVRVRRP